MLLRVPGPGGAWSGGVSAPRGGVPGPGVPGLGGAWSQGVPASGPGGYPSMQ